MICHMRPQKKFIVIFFAVLCLAIPFAFGSIATSEPPTLAFLEGNSEIIVTGIVTSVNVEFLYTNYSIRTYEVLKGSIADQFSITTGEGTNSHISPSPVRFEQGQEVIVFLNEKDGLYKVFWGPWGKRLLAAENEENLEFLRNNQSVIIDLQQSSGEVVQINNTTENNESRKAGFGPIRTVEIHIDRLRYDLPLFALIAGLIYLIVFRKE